MTERQVHRSTPLGTSGRAPVASVGDIAHLDKSGSIYVPTADQVGTIWKLLDSTAGAPNSYEYDAFGVGRSATETVANRYRFGTKRLDADPALYHFVARQYDAGLGRLPTRDQATSLLRAGALYGFSQQRPTLVVDPAGLWTEPAREHEAWAKTCAEERDTVSQLAQQLHLSAWYAYKGGGWLRHEDGCPVVRGDPVRAGS